MSVDNPKISVIIPCYNAGKTISASLRSLVNQVYKDFEVIIVNDGSTDNSADVISSFSRTHNLNVVYVEQPNSGVSTARNNALKKARGEYITFLDADDLYDPYFLQDGIDKLEKNGVKIPVFLKSGFEKLYVYTNNEKTGIRHALMDDADAPQYDEAKFMIVACSAFINYIQGKRSSVGVSKE